MEVVSACSAAGPGDYTVSSCDTVEFVPSGVRTLEFPTELIGLPDPEPLQYEVDVPGGSLWRGTGTRAGWLVLLAPSWLGVRRRARP